MQNNFTFYEIKEIVGLAGFDVTLISHLEQRTGRGASKGQLITAVLVQREMEFSDLKISYSLPFSGAPAEGINLSF